MATQHSSLGTFTLTLAKPGLGRQGHHLFRRCCQRLFPVRLPGPRPLCWRVDGARRGCLFLFICGFLSACQEAKMLVGGLHNWNIWDAFGSKGPGRPLRFDGVPGAGHVPRL